MRARTFSPISTASAGLIAPALLVLAAVAAYHGCFGVPFFFDDTAAVTNNPTIRNLRAIGTILSPPADGGGVTGRPLINLSLALNYAISGTDPRGYHLFNLAAHILTALLLFGLVRRTILLEPLRTRFGAQGKALAFCLAALWTVHPLQTESVTCVIQRTEVMFSLFYVLTLYAFLRSLGPTAARSWRTLSIGACALGMACKEVMVSAPIIVLLFDRTFVSGSFATAWRIRRGYYLGLAATWIVLLGLLLGIGGTRGSAAGFGLGVTAWSYALKQCEAIVTYLKLSLWPNPLVIDYGVAVTHNLSDVAPQAALILTLSVLTFVLLWKRPVIGFVLFVFFSVLAPSSSVIPLVSQTMAEHRMYLPLASVLSLALAGAFRLLGSRVFPVAIACIAALSFSTIARNKTLQDEVALWTETIAHVPANARAHGSLGLALSDQGRLQEAIPCFQKALRLDPKSAATETNIGNVYFRLRDFETALLHFRRTVAIDPAYASGYNSVGVTLQELQDFDGALQSFRRSLALDPQHLGARQNIARLLFQLNRFEEAAEHYAQVVRVQPDSAEAQYNLGLALARSGRIDEASQHFRIALQLRPNPNSYLNFARFLASAGRISDAITNLETALRLQPDFEEARRELVRLRSR